MKALNLTPEELEKMPDGEGDWLVVTKASLAALVAAQTPWGNWDSKVLKYKGYKIVADVTTPPLTRE